MMTGNSEKAGQEKGLVSKEDLQLDAFVELDKNTQGEHSKLTWNQGVAISDNKNSLRANPKNSTLLKDFVPTEEITDSVHQCAPECSKGTGGHGFFDLIAFH